MRMTSLLWDTGELVRLDDEPSAPVFFHDLNLDQIIDQVVAGKDIYHLEPFFYRPAGSIHEVYYQNAP